MTPSAHDRPTTLDLSREEEWVAHTALLEAVREAVDAGAESPAELRLVQKIEDGDAFDAEELPLLRDALVTYLGDAPLRDRAPGRAALRGVNAAIDTPSPNA